MTVYVTAAELLELEHARLSLRAEHGLAVDRGRLVREALHLVLADLEQNGESSALVRRLTEEMTLTEVEPSDGGGVRRVSRSGSTTSRARSTCCSA